MLQRAVVIVMDSCGVGAAGDAADYGDQGADTLGHVARAVGGLVLPNLQAAGLGNLHPDTLGVPPAPRPQMAFGRMQEASAGKDSTTGHWEIAGVHTLVPHATFTDTGFPPELVTAIEAESGHHFIGNHAASGTQIIEELGPRHLAGGELILYTSADSVLQIAAHENRVPVNELYRVCKIARHLADQYRIGRIIARPFVGQPGTFRRTYGRRDYALPPPETTLLDRVSEAGLAVFGVGKIEDLFVGRGLTATVHTEGDEDGLKHTLRALHEVKKGLVFTNLVDLDMLYGHREDPAGYARGLTLIDQHLPLLIEATGEGGLLILTADHGNDPTDGDTNHTREFVPLLAHASGAGGYNLGTRAQMSDIAATIVEGFQLPPAPDGKSFWSEIA